MTVLRRCAAGKRNDALAFSPEWKVSGRERTHGGCPDADTLSSRGRCNSQLTWPWLWTPDRMSHHGSSAMSWCCGWPEAGDARAVANSTRESGATVLAGAGLLAIVGLVKQRRFEAR